VNLKSNTMLPLANSTIALPHLSLSHRWRKPIQEGPREVSDHPLIWCWDALGYA
jgi:hypothetical protein